MKLKILFLILAVNVYGFDESALLKAIAIKEGGVRMGKAGEIGAWQMMPKTVRDAGGHDRSAALRHMHWLMRNLKRLGQAESPFNIALCWNAGFERATSGEAKLSSYAYAWDVLTIYQEKLNQQYRDKAEERLTFRPVTRRFVLSQ